MVKKLLAKTLDKLSSEELHAFLSLLDLERDFPFIWRRQLRVSNTQEVAELMVKTCGQECLDITKKVLKMMKRTDLVQRLSDMSTEIEGEAEKTEICEKHKTTAANMAVTCLISFIFYYVKIGECISWATIF